MALETTEGELNAEQVDLCTKIVGGVVDLIHSNEDFQGCVIPVKDGEKSYTIYIFDDSKQKILFNA